MIDSLATAITPWKDYAHKPQSGIPGVRKLLQRLEQEDPWFNYLVPPGVRNSPEEQLLAYLDNTYSAPGFRMEEPEEVMKYIQPRERVILKKDLTELCWEIQGSFLGLIFGEVKEVYVGKSPLIRFKCDWTHEPPLANVPETEISVLGKQNFLDFEWQKSIDGRPRKGDTVTYIGKNPLKKYRLYVPAGAEGVVTSEKKRSSSAGETVEVAFMHHPEVIVPSPSIKVGIENLALVRPNFIDYHKLRQESFTISDFDKPGEQK
ncbi:MAG: hypothetical protein AABY26_01495 [Nanoarchaeota archaeon]